MIYLDNAATTMVSKQVSSEALRIMEQVFGNPSSLYIKGVEAEQQLSNARKTISSSLGCLSSEFYFTSGGTESNNIAIIGALEARKAWANEIIVSSFEHPSVLTTVREMKSKGFLVREVKPKNGIIDPQEVLDLVGSKTAAVTVMRVNNETGAVCDISAIAKAVKQKNQRTAVHCDMVQGFLKYDIDLAQNTIDSVSISGHKLHAPKGIGGLYLRKGYNIKPIMFGGGQEKGMRSGTENVAFAVAFAKAVQLFDKTNNFENAKLLKKLACEKLSNLSDITINSPENSSPYILNFSVLGYNSETLIHFLERSDIYVAGGSACSKGAKSQTLTAMGLSTNIIDSALRISFSKQNKPEDIEKLVEQIEVAKQSLMRKK